MVVAWKNNTVSFADDTSLIISDTDISTLYQRANVEMNNLFEWFSTTTTTTTTTNSIGTYICERT